MDTRRRCVRLPRCLSTQITPTNCYFDVLTNLNIPVLPPSPPVPHPPPCKLTDARAFASGLDAGVAAAGWCPPLLGSAVGVAYHHLRQPSHLLRPAERWAASWLEQALRAQLLGAGISACTRFVCSRSDFWFLQQRRHGAGRPRAAAVPRRTPVRPALALSCPGDACQGDLGRCAKRRPSAARTLPAELPPPAAAQPCAPPPPPQPAA